jgi:hypothetical protein
VLKASHLTRVDITRKMNEHSFMASTTTARRPPALADRADKANKRDAILRAAIETFAARGFFNAQVADVARTAGVAAKNYTGLKI